MFLPRASVVASLAVAAGLAFGAATAHAQSAPFAGMAGVWAGNGAITLSSGAKERIRCRATYAVSPDGNGLQQTLRCASDSYRFELTSNVRNAGGRLTGTWSEQSRGVGGALQGQVQGNRFQVAVSTAGFTANVTLVTRGNSQNVTITSEGTDLTGAQITLART